MLVGSLTAPRAVAGEPAAQQQATQRRAARLRSAAERYFEQENLYNGIYVGLGASLMGTGIALTTRDDDGLVAAGVPVIAVGGVQMAVGIAYLALTPGWQRDASATLHEDPDAFVRQERERVGAAESLFRYYKIAEGVTALTGIGIGVAGAATDDATLMGVGSGLGVAACIQLVMEHITHDVAKSYLAALDRPARSTGGPLLPRWNITILPMGVGVYGSVRGSL
jgi:hypothetical protein